MDSFGWVLPMFASIHLTVLFVAIVGVGHRLRGKGQHLAHVRMKHH